MYDSDGDSMYDSDFALKLAQLRAKKGVSARDMSLSLDKTLVTSII